MKAQLDFNDYPDIVEGDIFWRPPPSALQQVPQLYERATSALYMLFLSGGSDIPIRNGVPGELHVAMHVRAALTEFVGIEEAMKNAGHAYRITNSTSPLLHFMRMLRNYQIHIGTQPMARKTVGIVFGGSDAVMDIAIINNLRADDFMQLEAIRKYSSYSRNEVERMIELFCAQQERLGVYEILRQGTNRLIHEVLKLI
ncbi:hypothetical protein D7Y57_03645 [Stenotrophomonas maltophilia]|jgi:hypothetical protein|uniref:hypothetical protein n=1 Tax=Stenotrophomonas maltophilia TaxID=40324 RepID=UPI00049FFF00|nr:hypothetical protein [Stenotrophomonas maltophilia]KDE90398.1 hypothetical protein DF40_017090 [Stenotrophomonas maltophilia M30]MBA0233251.1 hypothetical protein [Stenotrophomonas maltophilia]MBA0267290.1 hypothetical protein [Stenotrophomonas maltophilia]MBA0455234.1 hypothetical protein [Stenotrophomonas maltophilia]QGL75312.1 hypothetical protein FEO95_06580 [Stenotrophomonas maltophilia]